MWVGSVTGNWDAEEDVRFHQELRGGPREDELDLSLELSSQRRGRGRESRVVGPFVLPGASIGKASSDIVFTEDEELDRTRAVLDIEPETPEELMTPTLTSDDGKEPTARPASKLPALMELFEKFFRGRPIKRTRGPMGTVKYLRGLREWR